MASDTFGLGSLITLAFKAIHDFLSAPGWHGDCHAQYISVKNDSGTQYCMANYPDGTALTRRNEKTLKEYWDKPSTNATDTSIAHGKTCPPGTLGSNGLCYKLCPDGYETYSEEIDKVTYMSCRSTCDKGWSPLEWTTQGAGPDRERAVVGKEQGVPHNTDLCWHALPETLLDVKGEPSDALVEDRVDMPYNLFYQTTQMTDLAIPKSLQPSQPNRNIYGPQPFKRTNQNLEKAGIYATRLAYVIGASEPPRPCYAPNKITPSGRCVKDCGGDYELVGENCVLLKLQCPDKISAVSLTDASRCIPHKYLQPRGPSIILMIAGLGIFAIILGAIVKLASNKLSGN